ncbi:hypothetical protein [Ferrimonas marina]|uniref:Uncharacterized protein n=1 Tax=Ferrimonas marina TaxID=299255 RepID=A0A1M5T7Z8_9GAMM|nr:hypothetical protein [Ferrimonas marina]SHH46851.1 hypothetical protein SAMN02745129_2035 [Ferrimonas marina]
MKSLFRGHEARINPKELLEGSKSVEESFTSEELQQALKSSTIIAAILFVAVLFGLVAAIINDGWLGTLYSVFASLLFGINLYRTLFHNWMARKYVEAQRQDREKPKLTQQDFWRDVVASQGGAIIPVASY